MSLMINHNGSFSGFTTCSGKRVQVDPSAMERAKLFLQQGKDRLLTCSANRDPLEPPPIARTCLLLTDRNDQGNESGMHQKPWVLYAQQKLKSQRNTLSLCDTQHDLDDPFDEYVTPHIQEPLVSPPPVKKIVHSSSTRKREIRVRQAGGSSSHCAGQNAAVESLETRKKRKLQFLNHNTPRMTDASRDVVSVALTYKSKMSSLMNRLLLEEMAQLGADFNVRVDFDENACSTTPFTYPHSVLTVTRRNGSVECIHYDTPIFLYLFSLVTASTDVKDESRATFYSWVGHCNVLNELLFHSSYFNTYYREVARHYHVLNASISQDNFMTTFFNGSLLLGRVANVALTAHFQLAEQMYNQKLLARLKMDDLHALLRLLPSQQGRSEFSCDMD